MTDKSISVENLGPIERFSFSGSKPGVTVFSGPNGIGKSIFQKAIETAAKGKGPLPLRDGTKRGEVDAFGAVITIGGNCRHTGHFEVLSLSGRVNLAELVDPRIDTPALADNARIKALIGLQGVKAESSLFAKHTAFADSFEAVVDPASIETDDFVEMARKVKKHYDEAALALERTAERETGHAAALVAPKDLDLDDESDAEILQEAYNEARDVQTRLQQQQEMATSGRKKVMEADNLLKELGDEELRTRRIQLTDVNQKLQESIAADTKAVSDLEKQIAVLRSTIKTHESDVKNNNESIASIDRQLVLVDKAKKTLAENMIEFPSEEELTEATEAVSVASAAIERGTLIRKARQDAEKAARHRKAANEARKTAQQYRDAAKATDEVLSASIDCKYLRVESDGKAARLYTTTAERGKTLYHELSHGQKYKIAVKIGADAVGEGGLLTVDQEGWEGIDADNRIDLDRQAKECGVHIWVLEASREVGAPRQIVARAFDETPIPKAIVKEAEKILSDEAKPKADAKPAYKAVQKPLPKTVEPDDVDPDEIPF